MALSKLEQRLLDFCDDNYFSETIVLNKGSIGKGLSKKEKENLQTLGFPEKWIINLDGFFGFNFEWEAKPETGIKAQGAIKILELPVVFSDWKGQTYFENTPADSTLRDFKPIDIRDEYCDHAAGIYFGKNKTDFTFYYGELDGSELLSLDLDINGYIEMMIIAKGCYGWQRAIAYELHSGSKLTNIDDFKENMPKLFPDWTWEGFVQKFKEVRLNEVK